MKKNSDKNQINIQAAKQAALDVLLNNIHGPYQKLPRTAAWGYPEPYTRDLMIAALGMLATGDKKIIHALRRTFETLAKNQTNLGHISSLVHDPQDLGASDTTPLFLIGVALYRKFTGEKDFLEDAVQKAIVWMEYQSPDDSVMIAQLPTSDWRDEHWVLGYGLYVNTLTYLYLRLYGNDERAGMLRKMMNRLDVRGGQKNRHVHEGLIVRHKPYYAMSSYKIHNDERFDLLGNSLAILSGIAPPSRASDMIAWVEAECEALRNRGELAVQLPPCLIPYIQPTDPDWRKRYEQYNLPGEYHNGGVWPFICGFYVAALVAAQKYRLAEEKLLQLTKLIMLVREHDVSFGFNEWIKAQTGQPRGQDWQTWSAAMYLYAAVCVENKSTLYFDEVIQRSKKNHDNLSQ